MTYREKIESILRGELDRAIRCHFSREHEYRDILSHVSREHSSGVDADRLLQASLAELAAESDVWQAQQRLSDFENYGWVPDDVRGRVSDKLSAYA